MDASEFQKTYDALTKERRSLIARRDEIETDLNELRARIRNIEKVLDNLLPLTDSPLAVLVSDISQLGLTDAIRQVLQSSEDRLSATDVRRTLKEKDYNLSALTAPMASIYKILRRLSEKPDEVQREKEENGSVYYKWVGNPLDGFLKVRK